MSLLNRFLFWNVNKKDLTSCVCALAEASQADLVVLNESSVPSGTTLAALRDAVSPNFFIPATTSEKRFHCFSRRPELDMSEVHDGFRTNVRLWNMGVANGLLALVHGIDIRNYDAETRQSFAQSIADEMRWVVEQKGTKKLVLLGDFNMNPFDRGMNLAGGLNAMMTRACVANGSREHLGKNYDFYYNPMWGLFGDNGEGPCGTVYDTSSQGPYGWSMLDQVIIHHTVVPVFESVRIVTKAGSQSLMDNKGHPDASKASDHFPILVQFRRET